MQFRSPEFRGVWQYADLWSTSNEELAMLRLIPIPAPTDLMQPKTLFQPTTSVPLLDRPLEMPWNPV